MSSDKYKRVLLNTSCFILQKSLIILINQYIIKLNELRSYAYDGKAEQKSPFRNLPKFSEDLIKISAQLVPRSKETINAPDMEVNQLKFADLGSVVKSQVWHVGSFRWMKMNREDLETNRGPWDIVLISLPKKPVSHHKALTCSCSTPKTFCTSVLESV